MIVHICYLLKCSENVMNDSGPAAPDTPKHSGDRLMHHPSPDGVPIS